MTRDELYKALRAAGNNMTVEQISVLGREAEVQFGINRDDFMFILLSGKDEFKEYIFNEAGRLYKNDHARKH